MMPRISVDFLHIIRDAQSRIYLPAHVHPELMRQGGASERVIFIQEQAFEVEATLEFDSLLREWFAQPDWSTLRWLRLPAEVLASLSRYPQRAMPAPCAPR